MERDREGEREKKREREIQPFCLRGHLPPQILAFLGKVQPLLRENRWHSNVGPKKNGDTNRHKERVTIILDLTLT